MRILSVHNQFQQYGGADAVFAADKRKLAQYGHVISYIRASQLDPLAVGELDVQGIEGEHESIFHEANGECPRDENDALSSRSAEQHGPAIS